MPALLTRRLELIAADAALAQAALADRAELGRLLEASVPPEWPPPLFADGEPLLAAQLTADPALEGWLAWYVLATARPARVLVGLAGFAGPPVADEGAVRIACALLPAWQGRGLGTEAVGALLDWAFEDERTRKIWAEADAGERPAVRLLEKSGLRPVGRDGDRVRYQLSR